MSETGPLASDSLRRNLVGLPTGTIIKARSRTHRPAATFSSKEAPNPTIRATRNRVESERQIRGGCRDEVLD